MEHALARCIEVYPRAITSSVTDTCAGTFKMAMQTMEAFRNHCRVTTPELRHCLAGTSCGRQQTAPWRTRTMAWQQAPPQQQHCPLTAALLALEAPPEVVSYALHATAIRATAMLIQPGI